MQLNRSNSQRVHVKISKFRQHSHLFLFNLHGFFHRLSKNRHNPGWNHINDVTYYWYRFWFVHGVDYTFNYLGHAVCAVPPRLIDQLS